MIEENGQGAAIKVFESHGVKLFVDPISIRYLKGAEVDFRRHGHRRRLHDQEPASDVDLRLRSILQRRVTEAREDRPLSDLAGVPAAGGKRSTKREQILGTFLKQEGHLSADDLFDLVRASIPCWACHGLSDAAVDGGPRRRQKSRFRRRAFQVRADLPSPAALPSDLHELPPLIGF